MSLVKYFFCFDPYTVLTKLIRNCLQLKDDEYPAEVTKAHKII